MRGAPPGVVQPVAPGSCSGWVAVASPNPSTWTTYRLAKGQAISWDRPDRPVRSRLALPPTGAPWKPRPGSLVLVPPVPAEDTDKKSINFGDNGKELWGT